MISSPLFSVMIEQKLNLATLIAAVIAVLAWVFPFPDIGEKDKNDKDNQQEKAPKRNYYLKYRIIVFLICMAALVGTQGTVLCVLTKHPNKHQGARSPSTPRALFFAFPLFLLFFAPAPRSAFPPAKSVSP